MATESPMGSTAWVLVLDDQLRAAVGERELIYLIEAPTLLEVPLSPYYCRQTILWNNLLLPAMDLAAWLHKQPKANNNRKLAGIVAYQPEPNVAPGYGALLLADTPKRVQVADTQACSLPERPNGWRELAISCFRQGEDAIPILDLPHLFTGGLLAH
ncbi:MAG: chemotaxis protein CheW [Candidatus Competibacter sp.]